MSTICIIPARGGSTRIPMKNIKLFHGKPMIAYPIETAIASKLFDRIYVSTDSEEIADVARRNGASVLRRHPDYAKNNVGTQEVMEIVLDQLEHHGNACCLYPCTPLMTPSDLINSHAWLDTSIDYVFSVGANPLHDAGQWYWGKSTAFREKKELLGGRTKMYLIPSQRDCDINTPEDWHRAERMYARLHGIKL